MFPMFPDMAKSIQQQASAGTGDYHISTARINSLTATVTGGYLRNLYDVPYMDLTQPWYDANCIEDASLYDMLFYVTGSMIILDDDSTGAIVFNKQLINDFNLESPYKFVQKGTWTLDKFAEYAQTVASDLNGNGKVDLERRQIRHTLAARRYNQLPSRGRLKNQSARTAMVNPNLCLTTRTLST